MTKHDKRDAQSKQETLRRKRERATKYQIIPLTMMEVSR